MPKYFPIPEDQWARRRCAYELTKSSMQTIPSNRLFDVDIDIPAVAEIVRMKIPSIHAQRSRVASSLADFDMRTIDRLELYVQAMCYSHWLYQSTLVSIDRLQEWLDGWQATQEKLFAEANRLVSSHRLVHCRVELCPVRVYRQHDFVPLKRLFCLLHLNIGQIEQETSLRVHELVHAELVCELAALVSDCGGDIGAAKSVFAENRKRAFTLFLTSYDQVRRAMQFVRWSVGDADEIAPALERQPRRYRLDSTPPASNRFPVVAPDAFELQTLRA